MAGQGAASEGWGTNNVLWCRHHKEDEAPQAARPAKGRAHSRRARAPLSRLVYFAVWQP
jgi:hypothetical protein